MFSLLSIGLWLICFGIDKGSKTPYSSRGGGGDSPEPVQPKTQQEIAADTLAARQQTDPAAAQLEFGIQQEFMPQMTQLLQQQRETMLPGGGGVNEQLTQNILQNLLSPTGISGEQQAAQEGVRGRAVEGAQRAQRTRANLGGGLFGGRAQAAEQQDINNLMQSFAVEDINRQEMQRQNSQMAALQLMSQFFGLPVGQLNFQSPTASPEAATSASVSGAQQTNQAAQQEAANKAAMQSSLFKALATAVAAVKAAIPATYKSS